MGGKYLLSLLVPGEEVRPVECAVTSRIGARVPGILVTQLVPSKEKRGQQCSQHDGD